MPIPAILPRPLFWALFLSQQDPIWQMKPHALCKELQCKHVLSIVVFTGLSESLTEELFFQNCAMLKYDKTQQADVTLQKSWLSTSYLRLSFILPPPESVFLAGYKALPMKAWRMSHKLPCFPTQWSILPDLYILPLCSSYTLQSASSAMNFSVHWCCWGEPGGPVWPLGLSSLLCTFH